MTIWDDWSKYAYNLQGWQTHAVATILGDGDDYVFWDRWDRYYDGAGNRRYDGKLAQSRIIAGSDAHQEELYSNYHYDHLGRLVHGQTRDMENLPVSSEQLSYDRNGNITGRICQLGTESDATTYDYVYDGNILSVLLVYDSSDYTYGYDLNGAMTYDGKEDLSISRNILGLPCLIEDGEWDCVEISYLADGTKRYTIDNNGEGPRYYGSFIYAYDEAAGETQLESIAHGEGHFAATSYTSGHEPVFSNLHHVTDRLGSVVAVVSLDDIVDEGTDSVLEGNGYSPFGDRYGIGDFPMMPQNRFRFNGKEHLNRFSFPYIDYGARYYDPTIARWQRPDPRADKYPDISPYAFCVDDPVNFVDPQGDSLMICDPSIMLALYAGLQDGQHVYIYLNKGIVDPSSLDSSSDDFFMQDLYEIATSHEMVELSLSRGYLERNESCLAFVSFKEAPVDYDDTKDLNDPSYYLPEGVTALGKHVIVNTGRSLFPVLSSSMSSNSNIHVVINSSSNNYRHQAIGLAHEFSHVILYLRGLPYRHDMGGPADVFIYDRAQKMSKRLGYDN